MRYSNTHLRASVILLFCLLNIGFGLCTGQVPLMSGGLVGICYVVLITSGRSKGASDDVPPTDAPDVPTCAAATAPAARPPVDPSDVHGLVAQMLSQSRHTLLLRRQIVGNLSDEHFQQAIDALREAAAVVPEGDVVLSGADQESVSAAQDEAGRRPSPGHRVHVEGFFLDRFPVTNRQYYEFVAAGGYREMPLWETKIWPAVLDMVDQTGMPGPRYWTNGVYLPGEEELPVVGISWYEASACARWLGKRLPTDAEWVKAACWPVPTDSDALAHRRYPWGDTMDRSRANLWGSGPNRVVSVHDFAEGASVGGVYQLVGNVWQWTSGAFHGSPTDRDLELSSPMKNIRGGAFDTYFDNQATCQFQSGENPLCRRHNIGFRCAVGMCDVVLAQPAGESRGDEGQAVARAEETPA